MRYVSRDGGSMTKRRSDKTRTVALIATFLLLMAGFLVSAPGMMSASASGSNTSEVQDGGDEGHDDECQNDDDQSGHDDDEAEDEGDDQGEDEGDDQGEDSGGHESAALSGSTDDGDDDGADDQTEDEGDDEGNHEDDDDACGGLLTVLKYLENNHGGTLAAEDFQMLLDGLPVDQGVDLPVTAGVEYQISEVAQPGYELRGTVCSNDGENAPEYGDGSVTVAAGEHVYCALINDDVAPTITVHKTVVNDNDGTAEPLDFVLTINGQQAEQDWTAHEVMANESSIVSEEWFEGYTATSVVCTSDVEDSLNNKTEDGSGTITVTPALAENIDCTITNDDDNIAEPMDLAITKTDDGLVKVAGGESFDYTITVQNVGSSDVPADDPVIVTDQLPDGLVFVAFPDNCMQDGQTLYCAIDPADLEVDDEPVVITVTVKALAGTASDAYTNIAWVDTPGDPACQGEGCVPVCDGYSNNVDCESTTVTREASLTIDKVDDVDEAVHPGDVYSYMITVTNPGPSVVSDVEMTDDLPEGLELVSVSAAGAWTCNDADPVSCTYGEALAAGDSAPTITVTVMLVSDYVADSVHNVASATAAVDTPVYGEEPPSASDDETTSVVHEADLSIDKSVSQSTAVVGSQFNWFLAVTNHGPDTATNLSIDDTLPAQFQVLNVFPPAGVACTNTTHTVHCTSASLLIDHTVSVQVQVKVVAGAGAGLVSNTGTVTATSTDPVAGNNSDTASITITASAASQAAAPPAAGQSGVLAQLPRTGTSLGGPLSLAALLCGAGVLTLIIARRRRSATA